MVPRRDLTGWIAIASFGAWISGCAASVPLPREGDHEGDERVLVGSPPPLPKVEIVPPAPEKERGEVWLSGAWTWRDERWEWEKGRWVAPPSGASFAPPVVIYLDNKQIAWIPGAWRGWPGGPSIEGAPSVGGGAR